MKLDEFYHKGFSDYCLHLYCYFNNVSADLSSGLLQVFVELGNRGFNKGRSLKFRVGSRVRQTPEEGRRTYQPKCCGNNNKDEDNSPKTLNDKKVIMFFCFFLIGYS